MIFDTIENLALYRGLLPALDRGLNALQALAAGNPADGRHELSGSELYASVSAYRTEEAAAKPFEAHRKYIDLQYVLAGRENLIWAPRQGLRLATEYAEAEDIAFYSGPGLVTLPLDPGYFTVLFPWDAHKPGCRRDQTETVRKLVVKARLVDCASGPSAVK